MKRSSGLHAAASRPPEVRHLEQLVLAGLALTSEPSLERVLQRVAEVAADVLGARYTAIGLLGADGTSFDGFITHGMTSEERDRIGAPPTGRGVLGEVIREGRPIRIDDLGTSSRAVGVPPGHPPMRSFLGVPIAGRRGSIGNLYATEKVGADAFTDEDEHLATLLAAMAAAAAENATLHAESNRLLAEVHQLHRHRERFFAMVNHELRNALAAVLGWSELLLRRPLPEDVLPKARMVFESAEAAAALIRDLLDLSRLDEDRLRPVIARVEPAALTARAVARVIPAARGEEVRIENRADPGLPVIETDASRAEQILVNLLGNAVKYTPRHSTVTIETTVDGPWLRWRVRDQGNGVREDQAEKIFDIYVTAVDGAKQGIGLGLPLSRRLAHLLGGDVTVVPTDAGGWFELVLPVRRG